MLEKIDFDSLTDAQSPGGGARGGGGMAKADKTQYNMFNFIGVCCGMMWQGCYSILWPSCCLAKDYVLLYFYTFHSLTTIMFLQSNEPIIKEFQDNVCNFLVRFACLVQDYGQNQQVLNASSV